MDKKTFYNRIKIKCLPIIYILIASTIVAIFLSLLLKTTINYFPTKIQTIFNLIELGEWKEVINELVKSSNESQEKTRIWYLIIQITQSFFAPLPGQVICFVGGTLFGFKYGLLLSMIGMTIGSFCAMTLTRIFKVFFLDKIFSKKIKTKLSFLLDREKISDFLIIFLLPALPDDTVCLIGGLTKIRMEKLLLASFLGRLPGTSVAVFAGSNLTENILYTQIVIIGGIVITLIAWFFDEEVKSIIKNGFGNRK